MNCIKTQLILTVIYHILTHWTIGRPNLVIGIKVVVLLKPLLFLIPAH